MTTKPDVVELAREALEHKERYDTTQSEMTKQVANNEMACMTPTLAQAVIDMAGERKLLRGALVSARKVLDCRGYVGGQFFAARDAVLNEIDEAITAYADDSECLAEEATE